MEAPDVLFLSKTKHDNKWMEWWRWRLQMTNMIVKDSTGMSGGLALFWKKDVNLSVKSMSKYHIDAIIWEEDGFEWCFTGIYGKSRSEDKDKTWELLRELKTKLHMPWLCCEDFNEIIFSYEKEGGSPRVERCMEKFHQALEDCELHDLGFVGGAFTWRNHHHLATSYTKERLHRVVANTTWRAQFPLVRVVNGDLRHLDHRPIIVSMGERGSRNYGQPMDFLHKFEAHWLEEEECSKRVEGAWLGALQGGNVTMVDIQRKMLDELWTWVREVLGELERRIKNARLELERCRRRCISQENVNREHIMQYKLERL
jgi:hypothetical protein